MPNISIINETSTPLRLGQAIDPSPAYFDNGVAKGDAFHAQVVSVRIRIPVPYSNDI